MSAKEERAPTATVVMPPGSEEPKEDLEIPAGYYEADETPLGKKQGRSCCGCFCDMRRAVIILSLLGVFSVVVSLVTNYFILFDELDWDEVEDISEEQEDDLRSLFSLQIGLSVGSVVCYLMATVGALKYNPRMIIPNIIFVVASFVYLTVRFSQTSNDIESFDYRPTSSIGSAIGVAMTVYVNFTLIKEMRSGIMTPETYPREKQSCCCV